MAVGQGQVIHRFMAPRSGPTSPDRDTLPFTKTQTANICRDDFASQAGIAVDDNQIVRITRWSRDIELRDCLAVTPLRKSSR